MESPENPFDKLYQQITSGYNDKDKKLVFLLQTAVDYWFLEI